MQGPLYNMRSIEKCMQSSASIWGWCHLRANAATFSKPQSHTAILNLSSFKVSISKKGLNFITKLGPYLTIQQKNGCQKHLSDDVDF
jgi:hypothetical protein